MYRLGARNYQHARVLHQVWRRGDGAIPKGGWTVENIVVQATVVQTIESQEEKRGR
jgi:hypothetical protein